MTTTDRSEDQQFSDAVESAIDKHGLRIVLNTIAEIYQQKADHIRENWQDELTAKAWQRAAGYVERAAGSTTL